MSRVLLQCRVLAFVLLFSRLALAQTAILVVQTPITGNSGSDFFVFVPVANIGDGAATDIQLTSVALTALGLPVAAVLQPPTLPFVPGSGYLGPGGVRKLDFEFDNSTLAIGNSYTVQVSGTYQVNQTPLTFSLSVPVTYSSGFAATHSQVLDAILAKLQNVAGLDAQTDDQTMLAFVQGLPQVQSAKLGTSSPLVWLTFNDGGEPLEILNNVKLPAQPYVNSTSTRRTSAVSTHNTRSADNLMRASVADASGPTEIPKSIQARLLNAVGDGFANPVPDLHDWLVGQPFYYSDPINPGTTVDALRNVGGDGVFYMATHFGADPSFPPNIWTSTPLTDNPDPQLQTDIDLGYIIDLQAKDLYDASTGEWTWVKHYGITASFIANYWNFSGNSLVYIDGCGSGSEAAGDIRQAIFNKGASVYVGWSDEVGEISADTARFVFDRLLGANQFCPENGQPCKLGNATPPTFAQRPFDYTQVTFDLQQHGLGQDTNPTSTLQFEPNPDGGNFGLLAPTIWFVRPIEVGGSPGGTLQINGTFGSDLGQVTVGGQDCPVETGGWMSSLILCDLPSGAAGDVVVTVREHQSNKARITKWNGTFSYSVLGDGSLSVSVNYRAVFRNDVRKFRGGIHFPPTGPFFIGTNLIVDESSASYSCSGSATLGDYTIQWTGAGNMPASRTIGDPNSFQMILDGSSGPVTVLIISGPSGAGCDWTVVGPDGYFLSGHSDLSGGNFDIGAMPIEPNDPSFPADSRSQGCVPLPAFNPSQCKMQWNTIPAMFPPDPTSAR
jgi:hypothetical protein